jgi:TRL-like protein family
MKNISAVILLVMLSACAISNPPAGHGFIYTEATEVLYYDPYIKPQQKATLCSTNILGLFSTGDNSFAALKLSSGIRKISTMERTYSSVASTFVKSCLVVKGE